MRTSRRFVSTHNRTSSVLLSILLAAGLAAVGCHAQKEGAGGAAAGGGGGGGSASGRKMAPIAADSDRFPHGIHTSDDPKIKERNGGKGLLCVDCHDEKTVVEAANADDAHRYARPGLAQHAPCDREQCHKPEFYKAPGKFCQNCHTPKLDPTLPKGTQPVGAMKGYPDPGVDAKGEHLQALAAQFSHRTHLDFGKMEKAVGAHITCSACHSRDAKGEPMLPGHKECAACHTEKQAASTKLAMKDCQSCHPKGDLALTRGRIFITGDLKFSHTYATHSKTPCIVCHETMPNSRDPADAKPPTMQMCAKCHGDASKTPAEFRIEKCEVCHTQISSSEAPSNHLLGVTGGIPEDHTIAFRKNHGDAAAAKDARCSFCHTGLSGSTKDSCYECHSTWKPKDHTIAWREDEHGREAAQDRDRCAVCHDSDYCVTCHSVPPRSHQPIANFKQGGHAELARFDTRSCFACHTYQETCQQCHRSAR